MNKCFFVVVLLLAVSVCGCDGVADKPSSEDGVPGAEYQQQCERLGEKDQQVFHTHQICVRRSCGVRGICMMLVAG